MRQIIGSLIVLASMIACNQKVQKNEVDNDGPTKAEIRQVGDNYQLFVNDEPFFINGAGLEYGDISKLAEHGGNSFRTWSTGNRKRSGKETLDEAQKHGLYVTMGLHVASERHGFDYNDKAAVAMQLERIKSDVMELKDHPALIIWAIGNELNLNAANPNVWDAVNDISKMIHEIDPNHLTTSPLAGISKELISNIKDRAYDLDVLSVQLYADIVNLPKYIKETGWDGPYMVTEWGATGHWEVALTEWKAPIENNSTVKANYCMERYRTAIAPEIDQCIGSYVFLWGQKQERTPTWYGIFLEDGSETEAVDVMHYIWNEAWPENRSPQIKSFTLNGQECLDNVKLLAGRRYDAVCEIEDPESDSIHYRWDIKPESTDLGVGGDFESTPESLEGLIAGNGEAVRFTAPEQEGAYRLFIYGNDGNGHTAHANIPFYVN